jgi:hypothetical protein
VRHGSKNRIEYKLNLKYKNLIREIIIIFLNLCDHCQKKRQYYKNRFNCKPIVSSELNFRCQVDLIDLQTQPDGDYNFIMIYQNRHTQFVILRTLIHKRAEDVAYLLIDIFTTFGAPVI